jgi:hypothetical protein
MPTKLYQRIKSHLILRKNNRNLLARHQFLVGGRGKREREGKGEKAREREREREKGRERDRMRRCNKFNIK